MTPMISAMRGTVEFKMEAIAESISVSAYANKKDGKNVPISPDMASHFQADLLMYFNLLNPIAIRIIAPTKTRNVPT